MKSKLRITSGNIKLRVEELGKEISKNYLTRSIRTPREKIVALVVMDGAFMFAADLVRHIHVRHSIQFIRAKSYEGTKSIGTVYVEQTDRLDIDKHTRVLIIEDIVDTGRTINTLYDHIEANYKPKTIEVVALLDKPDNRKVIFSPQYTGFEIGADEFVIGYGLDINGHSRSDSYISVVEN